MSANPSATMDYHPLLDSVAILLLSSIVIGFTPASSRLRPGLLPLLVVLAWHCTVASPRYIPRSAWASSVGGTTLSLFLHYVDVAVLSQWSFDLQGPARNYLVLPPRQGHGNRHEQTVLLNKNASAPPQRDTTLQRLRYGLAMNLSWRFIYTPHQAPNMPLLDPSLARSRRRFLTHTGLTILICYMILDAMDTMADQEVTAKFYSVDKIPFFSRLQLPLSVLGRRNGGDFSNAVTFQEVPIRFSAAIAMGVGLISVQRGVYTICAFISVLSGLSEPKEWPPFNGPFRKITSLRKFWSVFWHQINTHRLRVISNFLCYHFLTWDLFPSNEVSPIVIRYMRLWTIFFVSGLLHIGVDISSGMSPHKSGAMRFFLMQPLAIVIEDVFLSACRFLLRHERQGPALMTDQGCYWRRMQGMLWVCLWMAWTAPAYLYPVIAAADSYTSPGDETGHGKNRVVPFSVIAFCGKGVQMVGFYFKK